MVCICPPLWGGWFCAAKPGEVEIPLPSRLRRATYKVWCDCPRQSFITKSAALCNTQRGRLFCHPERRRSRSRRIRNTQKRESGFFDFAAYGRCAQNDTPQCVIARAFRPVAISCRNAIPWKEKIQKNFSNGCNKNALSRIVLVKGQ